jgi:type IV secretion system protein VirB4
MNPSKMMKIIKQEAKVSALLPITHLNSPTVFESHSGFIGSTLRIKGVSFDTADPETLNYYGFLLHQAFIAVDERFIIYVTTHRKKVVCNLEGVFKGEFSSILNARYHERFRNQSLYTNDLYITLILKGDTSTKSTSYFTKAKKLFDKNIHDTANSLRDVQIEILSKTTQQLCKNLTLFGAAILGEQDSEAGFSELLEFLGLVVNAGKSLTFANPTYPNPIMEDIPKAIKAELIYPDGNLSQYLSRYHLLFGEYIQFQGNTPQDVQFGAMLSLKKYPTTTANIILDNLLSLDCEYITTHTFAPINREASLKLTLQKRSKLVSTEDKAISQIDSLTELEDGVASEYILLGCHHNTMMLIANSKASLENAISEVTKRYSQASIVAFKETLGLEPAFWSQIPCNHHLIARASLITSKNFVDFCPLHTMKTGSSGDNFLGSAVTLLESPSKTPVYFNFHAKGSKTNPTKGHTAVFGGNNSGKTTLINFLDSQMGRFNARSFYIDRDESSKIYILASGKSRYSKISPASTLNMNPLKLKDTPDNRSFLKNWFATLILEEGEQHPSQEISEVINNCIDYSFEQLSSEFRTLSNISQFLPVDFPRWPHVNKWLKGNQERIDGEFHWLFDNEDDDLNFDFDKVGFDVTYLMDSIPSLISTPVYLYLVHRMRDCLDGRITSFVIAEAWQVFSSPFWEKCLKEWLPTIRKKNGFFILDTQSPKTITTSPISHIVLDNLASMIVFPNPLASRDVYIEHLKLSETEFNTVKETTSESRIFLYKQDNESMLCKLDLSSLSDLIRVLSGNINSNKLLDEIIQEKGNDPTLWLPSFIERSGL